MRDEMSDANSLMIVSTICIVVAAVLVIGSCFWMIYEAAKVL